MISGKDNKDIFNDVGTPGVIPMFIRVNAADNVVIAVRENGIPTGTALTDDLTVLEDIPQAHKVSLIDLKEGDPIIRYGVVIGYAVEDIPRGSWINEDKVVLPLPPPLAHLDLATETPKEPEPLYGKTFMGYRNPDGSVGTKNLLGIMTCVQCVEGVVNLALKRIERELLPKYPNVDGIMPVNHTYGCGVAIDAPGAKIPIRTLHNIGTNPNFGNELLVISLGCEKLPPERLYPERGSEHVIVLQDHNGFSAMVDAILEQADVILERLDKRRRVECPASDLVVGLQCGGSDAFSGVTANPAMGFAADLLVRAGATVMFSEVTEVRDAIHLLTPRAVDRGVAERLVEEMAWYDRYLSAGEDGREANTTPGNKKGGLVNIVEKAMGSIAKSGSSAIMEVVAPGDRATRKGLVFAATPASDFICGTLQLAAGMTVEVFSTGRGTPYGLKMAPVIKVASRRNLKQKWDDLIDVDAGRIATGESTIEGVGREIFELILDVASGRKIAAADQLGIENALSLFNPGPVT